MAKMKSEMAESLNYFKSLESEQFLDSIVERLNKKQLTKEK